MRVENIKIGGKSYYLIYTHRSLLEKILNFVKGLENPLIIDHIAVVPKMKRLYLAARLNLNNLEDLSKKFLELAKSF
ncbi:hypothetical protein [Staphylothermus hellenicus]|uniref:Uncharacterized protein n=1 Tax=Staphylothermus hellenicus (strain DSM 12710 / JCM 10830 / BK20S6-10-b1 / P8) TaxID=591019 RepID=D7DC97_STAHD|nr:hypothetical protein [Staphylothermus hellenicus]ADI31794.1 hypothetical protein Shell_0671 [Staphylothermus hellenicus DSM 12710]